MARKKSLNDLGDQYSRIYQMNGERKQRNPNATSKLFNKASNAVSKYRDNIRNTKQYKEQHAKVVKAANEKRGSRAVMGALNVSRSTKYQRSAYMGLSNG